MAKYQKKGAMFYQRFKNGQHLTRHQAILAHCYDCNGEHTVGRNGKMDCQGKNSCPLYEYFPYKGV